MTALGLVSSHSIHGLESRTRYDFRVAFIPASSSYAQSDWGVVNGGLVT